MAYQAKFYTLQVILFSNQFKPYELNIPEQILCKIRIVKQTLNNVWIVNQPLFP